LNAPDLDGSILRIASNFAKLSDRKLARLATDPKMRAGMASLVLQLDEHLEVLDKVMKLAADTPETPDEETRIKLGQLDNAGKKLRPCSDRLKQALETSAGRIRA